MRCIADAQSVKDKAFLKVMQHMHAAVRAKKKNMITQSTIENVFGIQQWWSHFYVYFVKGTVSYKKRKPLRRSVRYIEGSLY